MEVKIVVGGEAGHGVPTIASIMSKFFLLMKNKFLS